MEILDSARFFQDKILSNHVVTDQPFRYLTKSKLLECSLISKKWISPCRQFLHRHHECLIRLAAGKQEHAPADLLKSVLITSKLLDDCDEIFNNGILWNIPNKSKRRRLTPNSKRNLKKTFKVIDTILKRFPKLQFLTLDTVGWPCIDYLNLVRRYPINLTEIEKLKILTWFTPKIFKAFFGEKVFPSLKTAYIHGFSEFNGYQERVLSSFPVLQEWLPKIYLYRIWQSEIKYFAQANKLGTIKNLDFVPGIDSDIVDQIEAANVTLLRVWFYLDPTTENVEIFRRITSSSTASLMEIELDYEFCKMLIITPGFRPFINVNELAIPHLGYVERSFKDMKAEMEANSNVQRLFPNANVVRRLPLKHINLF